jgi:hypothetical protein
MQLAEVQIMSSFSHKKELSYGGSSHSSMSETMQLVNDHVQINYMTEFESKDLDKV